MRYGPSSRSVYAWLRLVYSGCRKVDGQWQALLVTGSPGGFSSLDECYARGDPGPLGRSEAPALLQRSALIARMNLGPLAARLSPIRKHIFVRVEGEAIEVALIDLESRRRLTVNKASGTT